MNYFLNPSQLDKGMKFIGSGIREQAKKGKPLLINVTQAKSMKTKAQNSYYHCLITLICKETGEYFKDLRFRIKIEIGYYVEVWVNGVAEKRVKSMADVTIEESNKFIETAINICQFLGLAYQTKEQHYREINYNQ